jgi:hypothetical protein
MGFLLDFGWLPEADPSTDPFDFAQGSACCLGYG